MKIVLLDKQTIGVGPLDLLCCELIRQIRISAEPGDHPGARERIFSSPTAGRDFEADSEWAEYVHPELEELFTTHLDTIDQDLEDFPGEPLPAQTTEDGGIFGGDMYVLRIPLGHIDAWIHGLNQARLALAARHDFTESDMDGEVPLDGDERALALFQVQFYGLLEEWLLRVVMQD